MSLTYTTREQAHLLAWAAANSESEGFAADAVACAAHDGEDIHAVLVLQRRDTDGAEGHFGGAGGKWPTRRLVRTLQTWAFRVVGVPAITFPVRPSNLAAVVACAKIGAEPCGFTGATPNHPEGRVFMRLTPDNAIIKKAGGHDGR